MVASVVERPAPDLRVRSEVRAQLRRLIFLVVGLDTLTISLAIVAALQLKFGFAQWPPDSIDWFTGVAVIDFGWLLPLLGGVPGVQRRLLPAPVRPWQRRVQGPAQRARRAPRPWSPCIAYLVNYDMSRGFFALAFGLGTGGLLLERYAVRRHVARRARATCSCTGRRRRRRPAVEELHQALSRQPTLGYQLIGVCSNTSTDAERRRAPARRSRTEAVRVCREVGADTLLIAGGSVTSSVDLRRIGWELEDDDIDLIVVPSLIDVAGPRIHMRPVAGLPFVHVEPPQVARAMKWGKAIFDRLGSLLLLVALAPLFALGRSGHQGRERRSGLLPARAHRGRGQEFGVWKFRSMVLDADAAHQELVAAEHAGARCSSSSRPTPG